MGTQGGLEPIDTGHKQAQPLRKHNTQGWPIVKPSAPRTICRPCAKSESKTTKKKGIASCWRHQTAACSRPVPLHLHTSDSSSSFWNIPCKLFGSSQESRYVLLRSGMAYSTFSPKQMRLTGFLNRGTSKNCKTTTLRLLFWPFWPFWPFRPL